MSAITEGGLHRLLREKKATDDASRKGSELVAAFCQTHEVGIDTFRSLTDAALMPHIDKKSIWPLLERELELSDSAQPTLSSLQARCIDVLARDFDAMEYGDASPLRLQSATFLYELMNKSNQNMRRAED